MVQGGSDITDAEFSVLARPMEEKHASRITRFKGRLPDDWEQQVMHAGRERERQWQVGREGREGRVGLMRESDRTTQDIPAMLRNLSR